jgi:hypothetical protein
MKFDEQERIALTGAGFAVSDNNKTAYVEARLVIAAHDDETYWLTFSLPNETRIVCVIPRDQMTAAITDDPAPVVRRSRLQ